MTLENTCLMDIGEIISMYTAKNPLLEKFENALAKTFNMLEKEDPKANKALEKACFYKLSQIKGYITELNPYKPKLKAGDKMCCRGFSGRTPYMTYDPDLERACLCYLKLYYGEDLDKILKNMWSTYVIVNRIKIA